MIDLAITQQQTKLKILLIGDSCIDRYRIGTVDRLSPEAPVPVVKIIKDFNVPGMAANVFENLKRLNVDVNFITNNEEIIKTRYIDERSGQHLVRVDEEPAITPFTGIKNINSYDAVIISDYNKGFLTYEQIEKIIKLATCPVFIDTKKQDLSRFHGAFVKINELEFKNRYSINNKLIVTLGSKGAMFKQFSEEKHFPTSQVDVVDVCGCGDTFLSALVYQFLTTNNIEDAIIFANKASGITVQHQGNYAPSLEEIHNGH